MSANHFQQNKETLLFIGVGAGLIILFIINVVILIPSLITTYAPIPIVNRANAIDAQTVNKAVEVLSSGAEEKGL